MNRFLSLLLFALLATAGLSAQQYQVVKPQLNQKQARVLTGTSAQKAKINTTYKASPYNKKVVIQTAKTRPINTIGTGNRIITKARPVNKPVNPNDLGTQGPDSPESAEGYICRPITKKIYAGYDEHALISRGSANLFLGEMLDGQSLSQGILRPIQGLRQPYTISTAFSSDVHGKSARVTNHGIRGFREALTKALPTRSVTPADGIFESKTINRTEDLAVLLQANYDDITTSAMVRGGLKSSRKSFLHAVKFMQVYFRANINRPQQLNSSAFFTDGTPITNDQLIVSEIGYGRTLLFLAESNYESTTVEAAIQFATGKKYGGGETDIKSNIDYNKVLSESSIKVFAIGGGATEMIGVIKNGVAGIRSYLTRGANFSASSPGVPIYYKLSFVQDWADASTRVTTYSTDMKCRRASRDFQFAFNKLKVFKTDDGNGKDEIYGIGWCRLYLKHKQSGQPVQIMPDRNYLASSGRMFEIPRKKYYSMDDGDEITLMRDKWNFRFDYDDPKYGGYNSYDEALKNAYWYINYQVKEADDGSDDEVYGAVASGGGFRHPLKNFTGDKGAEITFRPRNKIVVYYTAGPDNQDL